MHDGAVCPLPHRRTEDALNGAELLPAVSFVSGFFVWVRLCKSSEVSVVAVGRGTTVGVMVAEVVRGVACVSVICYVTGVAVPVKFGNGLKVTVPSALTVYVPWFATSRVVTVQLFGVWPLPHSLRVALFPGYPGSN